MQLAKALLCQILAAALALAILKLWPALGQVHVFLALQAGAAAFLAIVLRQPSWWLPIHLLFLPCIAVMQTIALPAESYLLGFLVLILLFWGTIKGDVPLFLSSSAVGDVLPQLVAQHKAHSFVDLGAGIGSVTAPLAKRCPALLITAVERAPLTWLIAYCRCWRQANVTVTMRDLWHYDLSSTDMVFAFLSPVPMPELGKKIRREMRPGSLFISSSFPIPDWQPDNIIELVDLRKTKLYCYQMPNPDS